MPEAEETLKDKPRSGVYTALLIISAAFTAGAIAVMYNELTEDYYYGQQIDVATKLTNSNREDVRLPDPFLNEIEVTQEDIDEYAKLPDTIEGKAVKVKPPKGPIVKPDKLPEIEAKLSGGEAAPPAEAKKTEAPPAPPAPANP
jgi:hypothetical protein